MKVAARYEVCQDCMEAIEAGAVKGSYGGIMHNESMDGLWTMGAPFSWRPCELCGSRLGGYRYPAVELIEASHNIQNRRHNVNRYRLVGVNDEQDWCCLCGKTGLKRVYWLDRVDPDGTQVGALSHYGSECAAQLLSVHASTPDKTRKLLDSCVQETVLSVEKAELDRRSVECVLADVMGDGHKSVYVPSDMVDAEWTPDNILALRQRMKARYPLLYCQSMTELRTKVLAQLRAS